MRPQEKESRRLEREGKGKLFLHYGPQACIEIAKFLKKYGVSGNDQGDVVYSVSIHEKFPFSPNYQPPERIEDKILQDADRLDAIGPMAVARTFTYGGGINRPIWSNAPLTQEIYDPSTIPSTIHFIVNNNLRLYDSLHTPTAKVRGLPLHKQTYNFIFDIVRQLCIPVTQELKKFER